MKMINQFTPVPANTISKSHDDSLNKTCNTPQHLSPKGHFIAPKIFSGFQRQQIKLISTRKQSCSPRMPSPRRTQRDEVSCRLSNEPLRQTTTFAQFQNIEPKKEDSFIELAASNWNSTPKTPMGNIDSSIMQHNSSAEFDIGSGIDTPQKEYVTAPPKIYRSSSLLCTVPSATLAKSGNSNELNIYNYHNNSQTSRYCLTKTTSNKRQLNVFRSSSIHAGESAYPWFPVHRYYGSKSTHI